MRKLLLVMLTLLAVVPASAGIYRNAYFCGTMPWQRTFHDVNLCTGNLMKSFTDIQVAPARGAGLVLQRTYNSNDDNIDGAFGHGWSHAYDIRMEEASSISTSPTIPYPDSTGTPLSNANDNQVVRTDFFGGKRVYTRDADGLYSPPPYTHDWMQSSYSSVLATGPGCVSNDTDLGLDGTTKHYTAIGTGTTRYCDSITDRHGNATKLIYDTTTSLLSTVTDPSSRSLHFHWANLGTSASPHWRIVQVDGPIYSVRYDYGADNNLQAVHLDPTLLYPTDVFDETGQAYSVSNSGGLDRTTTYTYTSYNDGYGNVENGLLASITDPLGHVVSYDYAPQYWYYPGDSGGVNQILSLWVGHVTEPGGVDATTKPPTPRSMCWSIGQYGQINGWTNGPGVLLCNEDTQGDDSPLIYVRTNGHAVYTTPTDVSDCDIFWDYGWGTMYDDSQNVINTWHSPYPNCGFESYFNSLWLNSEAAGPLFQSDSYHYGNAGNVLDHWVEGYSNAPSQLVTSIYDNPQPSQNFNWNTVTGADVTTYYTEEYYFQKQSVTDALGHVTTFGYGSEADYNTGNRGSLLWVRDAAHQPDGYATYYTYNQCGQKTSEYNLNGVMTVYNYDDQWGNLTSVVQDADDGDGNPHLSRTTIMQYDPAGHVIARWDPNNSSQYPTDLVARNYAATVQYNNLGQPVLAHFPAPYSENISYQYGGNGRLASVSSDVNGSTSLQYEDNVYGTISGGDRVASVTDFVTGSTNYTYDLLGSVISKTFPDKTILKYTYQPWISAEGYNREALSSDDPNSFHEVLYEIQDDSGHDLVQHNWNRHGCDLYDIQYDGNNSIKSACSVIRVPDYVQIASTVYDPSICLTRGYFQSTVNTHFPTFAQLTEWMPSGPDQQPISENDYTYDSTGNRLTNTITFGGVSPGRKETYQYDALSRLTNVDYGDGNKQTYSFDDMGNRLSLNTTSYGYNNANMLTSVNGQQFSYDPSNPNGLHGGQGNGDLWTDGVRTNTWDSQNRLHSCAYNGTTSTFTYGADGLRRSMTVGNQPTVNYVLDGQNVAQEGHIANNQFVTDVSYLNGPRGPEYRENASGNISWYVYDGLGSVIAELDTAANITATREYDVYGAPRGNSEVGVGDQMFCGSLGHTTEPTTGNLIYMRARWMDPVSGRFISEDPKCDGNNWYTYVRGNPVNKVDPTGLLVGLDDSLEGDVEWGAEAVKTGKNITWDLKNIFNIVQQETGISRQMFGDIIEQEIKQGVGMGGADNIGLITKGANAGHLITSTGEDLGNFIDWFTRGY